MAAPAAETAGCGQQTRELQQSQSLPLVPQDTEAESPHCWKGSCAALGFGILLCGVVAACVAQQTDSRSSGFLQGHRRLEGGQKRGIYCTENLGGYVDRSTPGSPIQVSCPAGLKCRCSSVREDEWLCREEEAAAPCSWAPSPPPAYPKEVFFASFRADLTSAYGGTSAIWNSTGWWVFDAKGRRQRKDITTHVRSLSSGSYLSTFRHTTRSLDVKEGDSSKMVSYDASTEDLFLRDGSPTCKKTVGDAFPDQPVAGNALRFLPAEYSAHSRWSTHKDRYLGTEYVDGRATTLWGWTEMWSNTDMEVAGHRVWLDSADGTPVREEQWDNLGGYGTRATVHFGRMEDAYGSFGALMTNTDGLFQLPKSCQ